MGLRSFFQPYYFRFLLSPRLEVVRSRFLFLGLVSYVSFSEWTPTLVFSCGPSFVRPRVNCTPGVLVTQTSPYGTYDFNYPSFVLYSLPSPFQFLQPLC